MSKILPARTILGIILVNREINARLWVWPRKQPILILSTSRTVPHCLSARYGPQRFQLPWRDSSSAKRWCSASNDFGISRKMCFQVEFTDGGLYRGKTVLVIDDEAKKLSFVLMLRASIYIFIRWRTRNNRIHLPMCSDEESWPSNRI